jgi:hypothetical protein
MTTDSPDSRVADGRGNSNDRVRRHNLSVVLCLAHRSRGISRSALTRQTGLNRSTIAALVGELVERQLLIEVEPDASNRVGRPSPIALPAPRAVVFAVNPEVDAITVGLVGLGGTVLGRIRRSTDGTPTVGSAVAIAAESIAELRARFEPEHVVLGIGVAIPGLVRARDGVVRLAPHLGWVDEPFSRELAHRSAVAPCSHPRAADRCAFSCGNSPRMDPVRSGIRSLVSGPIDPGTKRRVSPPRGQA